MNSTSSAPPGLSPHRLRTGKLGRHLALLGLALLPALIFLVAESWLFDGDLQLPLDDSWIHLVFARSLSHGNGLAFNPGELVAGTTAPLWTALLGLLALLPGSPILWAKLAGIAAQAGSVFAVHRVALRLDFSPARALVAALLVAVSDWLVWSSLSGMEVNLFVLLFLAGLARHLRERAEPALPPVSFVLFGLAALARPEGLLLPFLALADRLFSLRAPQVPRAVTESGLRGSRPSRTAIASALSGILVALLVVVPVALAFHSMSGSFLPTTVAAKSSGPPMLVPDGRLLATVLGILFASQPWMTLLALGGVVESVRRFGGARDRGLLLALWTLALPLASAMLSSGKDVAVGNFGRYFFPLIPCVVLLGLLALAPLSFAGLRSATFCGVRLPVGALALVLLFAPTLVSLTKSLGRYLTSCANVRDSNVALAKWLGPRLPPDAVLAVNDVGAFKYLLPNRVLDLVGLMTPEVTHLRQQGARDGKVFSEVLAEFLDARKPDFVIVFPSWFAFPAQHPDRFHLLRMVSIRDNITMGGEMIALYDTPWTRRPLVALRGDEEPAETTAQPLPTESR
ncbi:MAG: hypothetical protein ABI639_06890 [Thermoanaerobaculia bacterium]